MDTPRDIEHKRLEMECLNNMNDEEIQQEAGRLGKEYRTPTRNIRTDKSSSAAAVARGRRHGSTTVVTTRAVADNLTNRLGEMDLNDSGNRTGGKYIEPAEADDDYEEKKDVLGEEEDYGDVDDDENVEWVRCDDCEKWRKLPSYMSVDELPDSWYCKMNTWNPKFASCTVPQEQEEVDEDGDLEESTFDDDDDFDDAIGSNGRRMTKVPQLDDENDEEFDPDNGTDDDDDSEDDYDIESYDEESDEEIEYAGEDDLSDSDLCEEDRRVAQKHHMDELPKVPKTVLSLGKQLEALEDIDNDPDRALQKILYNAMFQYKLHEHQFKAVRLAAGVPHDFPYHRGSRVGDANKATIEEAKFGLNFDENKPKYKGHCIADAMGLGKTVEAVAGAILANEVADAMDEEKMPTLIISPNDAVQKQWRDTLLENGVPLKNMFMFKKSDTIEDLNGQNDFILLTRYTAATEIRAVFDASRGHGRHTSSALFPQTKDNVLLWLRDEYEYHNSKGRRTIKRPDELREDCVTRILDYFAQAQINKPMFRTCIVDEAHFFKNRLTFWTMAVALSCVHSSRTIPMTGTPYNNQLSDLATLMSLIDPRIVYARSEWWNHLQDPITETSLVRMQFILRRNKDAIKHLLTPKIIKICQVSVTKGELEVYEHYEDCLSKLLKKFQQLMDDRDDPIAQRQLKDLFKVLMGLLSSMRMSLVHPLLPGRGREITKLFSPSRCKLLKTESLANHCVCCQNNLCPLKAKRSAKTSADFVGSDAGPSSGSNVNDPDDDMMDGEEDFDECVEEAAFVKDKEPVFEIPKGVCGARAGVMHFAHHRCINKLKAEHWQTGTVTCPRCLDLKSRAVDSGSSFGQKYWCKGVVKECPQGFVGSAKLNKVAEWAKKVPRSDKIVVLSFFKGCLDLVEAIFVHEFKWKCCRFDGDVKPADKQKELDRFKTDKNCRVLLMTVQSGGVRLNLTEANHVAFLDRWFNPFVHEQAEDRCHRLKQKKKVLVNYFDCAGTFDEAMIQINQIKQANSEALFDGEQNVSRGAMSYTDVSGLLGKLVESIRRHRADFILENEEKNPHHLVIPPACKSMKRSVRKHKEQKSVDKSKLNGLGRLDFEDAL